MESGARCVCCSSLPHYKPSWIEKLQKDDDMEEINNAPFKLKMLPDNIRMMVWDFSTIFGGDRVLPGMAGQATRIFERFGHAVFKGYNEMYSDEWFAKTLLINCHTLLGIAVSVKLACRRESPRCPVSTIDILAALEARGRHYTNDDLNVAEWRVFSTIGSQIPMWTNVQKVQMLTAELGYGGEYTIQVASLIMNIIERNLPLLYNHIRTLSRNPLLPTSPFYGMEPSVNSFIGEFNIPNLHLQAGVVVATGRYMNVQGRGFAYLLASWIGTTTIYVRWLCEIVMSFVNERIANHLTVHQNFLNALIADVMPLI